MRQLSHCASEASCHAHSWMEFGVSHRQTSTQKRREIFEMCLFDRNCLAGVPQCFRPFPWWSRVEQQQTGALPAFINPLPGHFSLFYRSNKSFRHTGREGKQALQLMCSGPACLSVCLSVCPSAAPVTISPSFFLPQTSRRSPHWCERSTVGEQYHALECCYFWVSQTVNQLLPALLTVMDHWLLPRRLRRRFSPSDCCCKPKLCDCLTWKNPDFTLSFSFSVLFRPVGTPFEDGKLSRMSRKCLSHLRPPS